ncbi:MAG: hypothetical protein PHV34_19865 [Verrucomicrobiae bacterium]|nr:hypothetical protein [Verrucomicrobiae bacterium]
MKNINFKWMALLVLMLGLAGCASTDKDKDRYCDRENRVTGLNVQCHES